MSPPLRLRAMLVSCLASGLALLVQSALRESWQVRTLPERVMEWLLLFVPLGLFERGVQRLGGDAKEVALAGTMCGMVALLVAVGALALAAGWTSWRILGLSIGLWAVVMGVVMPVTGAGFLASGLLISPWLTNAGYLLMFLVYGCVLMAGRLLLSGAGDARQIVLMSERRALLGGILGVLAAGGAARLIGRDGGLVGSALPLATVSLRASPEPTSVSEIAPMPLPPQPTGTPPPDPLPNPPPPQLLARDKDGSLTAAGRTRGELAPAITPNADFYVVTKNAVRDPVVDAAAWRIVLDGEVNQPVQVDYRALRALPAVELTKTLECISNFTSACYLTSFGCDLISTARWRGARLADVLELAGGLKAGAVALACLSLDEFSAGLPASVLDDPDTLVAYEMNGEPLPREHGFPARLLVPGRYGMKGPKWLAGIRALRQEYQGWYEQRNWNKDGTVKTMSRIDVPVDGGTLSPGDTRLAGIAYAGNRGVSRVEFSTDAGATWQPARILEPTPGKDAMVRWESSFVVPARGSLTVTTRATDGTGQTQTADFELPQPDGASGRDAITITAAV